MFKVLRSSKKLTGKSRKTSRNQGKKRRKQNKSAGNRRKPTKPKTQIKLAPETLASETNERAREVSQQSTMSAVRFLASALKTTPRRPLVPNYQAVFAYPVLPRLPFLTGDSIQGGAWDGRWPPCAAVPVIGLATSVCVGNYMA
jgi:hypothetical protein